MAVRQNIITGEPILFAPERAQRPHAFGRDDRQEPCPFCPGHERDTPPEIDRIGDPWRVRAFPNKYPAAEGHEIIVESPDHEATFDGLAQASEVVEMYIRRYRAHEQAAYISLFKNHGERAGASIDHLHSQLLPLPFLPPRVAREGAAFAAASACMLCSALAAHRRESLVIDETARFAWIAPRGSWHSYQQWILPKGHISEMTALDSSGVAELAALLQRTTRATRSIASSYNVVFMNFPRERSAHFYIDVFPRLTAVAGLELGTGTFIEIVDPAAAARRLQHVAAH